MVTRHYGDPRAIKTTRVERGEFECGASEARERGAAIYLKVMLLQAQLLSGRE